MRSSLNDEEIKEFFQKHPEADTDLDGVLADFEYEAIKAGEIDGEFKFLMVPMRDGTELATDIYFPSLEGKHPVLLVRTPYGRLKEKGTAERTLKGGSILVAQDIRGDGGSEGEAIRSSDSFYNEIQDGYDMIQWVSQQPWCNGTIVMTGGSGRGMASCMALWSMNENLTAVIPYNTAGNPYMYWAFKNNVATFQRKWLNSAKREWDRKKPIVPQDFNLKEWEDERAQKAPDVTAIFTNFSGWYDPLVESALDDFSILAPYGKAFVKIEPRGHSGDVTFNFPEGEKKFTERYARKSWPDIPKYQKVLQGQKDFNGGKSAIAYFLMGDVLDPNAPGGHYVTANEWPVPHEAIPFYLSAEGRLAREISTSESHELTYAYDPNDPAPTIGGHWSWNATQCGPKDQRPLHERKDILRFSTGPLEEPLTITGMIKMNLYVSTDVSDTLFVVKVLDIYPNGYEALVCEAPYMLRYHDGLDTSNPAEPGEVYKLNFNLRPTAIAFNKGHKIGIMVTSSSTPEFEIHPNSYEQVFDYSNAPVANNTVYFSKKYPSCVILPVIPE